MKKLLLFVVMFILCNDAIAQVGTAFVQFKNNAIVYGEIIENINGKHVRLKDGSGKEHIYSHSDILQVTTKMTDFYIFERKKARKAKAAYEAKAVISLPEVHNDSLLTPTRATPTNNQHDLHTGSPSSHSHNPNHHCETIKLRAQTSIPMKATYKVHAKDVLVGDRITFKVSADIYQDGKLVIPAGTKAYARVTKARKSIPIGIQGRLEFVMDYLVLHNGQRINLEGRDIKIKGKNRTRMAFGVALVTLGFGYFIPGTKAVLPQGYEVVAHTLSEQEIMM